MEYCNQVTEARSKGRPDHLLPDRIDMTKDEIWKIYETPVEEIKERTLKELSDYRDELETLGLAKTMELVNKDLDEAELVEIEATVAAEPVYDSDATAPEEETIKLEDEQTAPTTYHNNGNRRSRRK